MDLMPPAEWSSWDVGCSKSTVLLDVFVWRDAEIWSKLPFCWRQLARTVLRNFAVGTRRIVRGMLGGQSETNSRFGGWEGLMLAWNGGCGRGCASLQE
jgi:hypothetical protein